MRPALLSFVLLVCLLTGMGCSRQTAPSPVKPASESAYVKAGVCTGCHAGIAKTYMATGMGRASFAATPATMNVEDFRAHNRVEHGASNRSYQMIQRDDRFFLRRHQKGYQGQETNVVEMEIHYVMGSGNHARSYLHRTPQNRLIELPVGWYSEGGGKWAMSPGFDRPKHPDFRRTIGYGCMFCHNAYPDVPAGTDLPGADAIYPASLPSGIDCQRCHGAGRAHVEAARGKRPASEIRAAIVNPKRLPPQRQADVCRQCHLETTSWPLPHAIQKFERGTFSYRPGEPLYDYALHFDHAPGSGRERKFEIVNSFYRLEQSKCFLKSKEGTLTCTTCHNPHQALRGVQAQTHYAKVCKGCHEKAHAPSPDCASCHMPKRRTEDVVHVVMTDHLIQRRAPPNLLSSRKELTDAEGTYRGEVVLHAPLQAPDTPERDLYLALAQVAENSNGQRGISRLAAAIQRHRPKNPEFLLALAQAQFKNGLLDAAITSYQQALQGNPSYPPALIGLGAAYAEAGRLDEARTALEQACAKAPNDPVGHHELARAYLKLGQFSQAVQEAETAIRLDPHFPAAQQTLASAHGRNGNAAAAETAWREAIRLQPDFAEPHTDLANLLVTRGDFGQAEYHFLMALQLAPREPAIRYNYAVSLAMAQRYEDARRELEHTLQASPSMAVAHEALGSLAARQRQWPMAVRHYQRALVAQPDFGRAQLGLGTALGATGDLGGARRYLSMAVNSGDPAVKAEAAEIIKALEDSVQRR